MLDLIILALAAWRLTSILNREYIAWPLRKALGAKKDATTGGENYPDTVFGYLISCFICLSVWVSLLILILWFIYPPLIYPFALSGGAILVERYI